MRKYLVIGASKGLGREISIKLKRNLLLASRSLELLSNLKKQLDDSCELLKLDCSKLGEFDSFTHKVKVFNPTHVYYVSGGGPYGKFIDKSYKDHQWAFNVNFLFPAQLLHWCLGHLNLEQFIYVGSSVAEAKPDAFASSYAASKHAMKGLLSSIISEGCPTDVRLFSPPYMDTNLLPANAIPRTTNMIKDPAQIAGDFMSWANDADGLKHKFIEVE